MALALQTRWSRLRGSAAGINHETASLGHMILLSLLPTSSIWCLSSSPRYFSKAREPSLPYASTHSFAKFPFWISSRVLLIDFLTSVPITRPPLVSPPYLAVSLTLLYIPAIPYF